jgi:hypothetical protein
VRRSTLAILALWAYATTGSVVELLLPVEGSPCPDNSPAFSPPFVFVAPFAVFGWLALRAPHSPFFIPALVGITDKWFGPSAYLSFLVRLKPLLMFGVSGVVGGVVTMLQCVRIGAPWDRSTLSWFFLSAGVAFMFAHLVLRYRRVPGV